ncbi:MAG: hypothetical protein ABIG96_01425 [Candidatus Micrarchaeota archaeon]
MPKNPPMPRDLTMEIYHYIDKFVSDHGWQRSLSTPFVVGQYSQILEHMLVHYGLEPEGGMTIAGSIRKLVKNRRIAELGCREGGFLKFLEMHGAIIAGSTGEHYIERTRKFLGEKTPLAIAQMENAGESEVLRQFRPDIIFSYHFFHPNRWKKLPLNQQERYPANVFFRAVSQIATPGTQVFVYPSGGSNAHSWSHNLTEEGLKKNGITEFEWRNRRIRGMDDTVRIEWGKAKMAEGHEK